nr:glycosyltransferase family 4 protein [Pseudomonas aeruginosa]
MRVIYFHQHFSTPKGMVGIRSYEMARRLIARGHQVTMVCGSYGGGQTGLDVPFSKGRRQGTVDGIDIIEFDLAYSNTDGFIKRTTTFFSFALRSIRLAMTEEYDLVFATTTPLTAGIPGIFARWLRGKAFVFEVRDLWPELPKAMGVITNPLVLGMMSVLEWLSYRSAHRLIGLSPGIVEGIERLGVPASHLGLQVLANVPAFYYGTSPNKFFDYIAAGLPVLNNYPGWLAGMIADNRCGFAVEPDSPTAFADALERAADDRESLRAMGERGRALAVREFERHKLADRFVDWLEGVKS